MNKSLYLAVLVVYIFILAGCAGEPTATPTLIRTNTTTLNAAPTPMPTLEPTPAPISTPISEPVWLSAGPRGLQFTNDFQLTELFRADPTTYYWDLTAGHGGRDIYAIREQFTDSRFDQMGSTRQVLAKTAVVRLYGLQEERAQAEVVFYFGDPALKDPALWDPGTDLSGTISPECCDKPGGKLSVANNGDLFFVARAWTGGPEGQRPSYNNAAHEGASLIVRRVDGTLQKILTVPELVDAGVLGEQAANQGLGFAVAASAPDRVWLDIYNWFSGRDHMEVRRFYEIQDPNRDGDWSDRTVVGLSLPDLVTAQDYTSWFSHRVLTEPSVGGQDRSRSFLLQMAGRPREKLIYRVSDYDGNGDALGQGEFELLFSGFLIPGKIPYMSPRIVVRDGRVVLEELVTDSFTKQGRVSRILETGEVVDIARGFSDIKHVVAGSGGNIYVWGSPAETKPAPHQAQVLYRLAPVPVGTRAEGEAVTAAAQPFPTPEPAGETLTPGVPRIA